MIDLRVSNASGVTGDTLAGIMRELGSEVSVSKQSDTPAAGDVVASYGMAGRWNVPTLNSRVSASDKFDQLRRMGAAGVPVPAYWLADGTSGIPADAYPLLARKRRHRGGKDIKVVLQPEEIPWRIAAGAEAFVKYVPWVAEHRVWVYRGRHLGTYRKVQAHPELYRWTGMNQRNGFGFVLVPSEEVNRSLVDVAGKAVDALGLDFGAVDVLTGKDETDYVLEVNTAPGVEGEGRQAIRLLAAHIVRWSKNPTKRKAE